MAPPLVEVSLHTLSRPSTPQCRCTLLEKENIPLAPPPRTREVRVQIEPCPRDISFLLQDDSLLGESIEVPCPQAQYSSPEKERSLTIAQSENSSNTKHTTPPPYSNIAVPCNNLILSASFPEPGQQGSRAVLEQVSVVAAGKTGGQEVMTDYTTKDTSYQSDSQSESPSNNPAKLPPGPGATRREPLRHTNTVRKIHDWTIEIIKPIVILGDSNLSRIPSFVDARVQVDSFPGATFYHLKGVLEKLPPNPNTERVVVAAGLNNCLSSQTSNTTWKQLQQLLKVCETKFPSAVLHIPLINFSDRLERDKQALLKILNTTIMERCNFLLDLNRLRFHTEPRDPVHWTAETATAILKFWLDQLNM